MNITLEETLNETCMNLTSVRATERKKSAETLKEYLSKNALPALLTHNTLKKSGYNWNNVFDDINDYILKETEKFETSKTFHQSTVPLCSSLLLLCVAGSNKDQAYIKCEKITKACLFVLNDSRLTEAIGDAYISLLYKYVLTCEHYLSYISPPTWENLLDVCISSCNRQRSTLDDLLKTRLLWLVIHNASDYSLFAIPLRDSLSRLKKCCIRALNNKKVQEFSLKIVILILEALSSESRLTACEFSESILPPIFKIYEQSMEQKKKSLLFKLCEIAIKIHNPLGRLQGSNVSMAHNWDTWNKNVSSMLEIVCHEVSHMQKVKKQNDLSMMQCYYFCYVGASAFFQVFSMSENIEDIAEAGNSAKKLRITFNTRKSFNELIEELRLNCAPWIGIMQMFVKHFNAPISYTDYISLVRVLEDIIQDSQRKINWDKFEDLSCMVINNLLSLEVQNASDILVPLWNTCVRNAAVSGNAQKAIHSIILVILNSVPLKYDNVKPLFLLYIEKGIPVNDHTVATLNSLYHKFYKKTCYLEMREKYFAWLINGNIINLRVECVKELLLRLLSNDNIGKQVSRECSEGQNVYDIIFKCAEKSILYSEFEYRLDDTQKRVPETIEHFEINSEMDSIIEVYLKQKLSLRDENDSLIDYCRYLNLGITYIHLILKYKLKTESEVASTSLYTKLQRGLRHFFTALTQCLTSDMQIWNKVAILKSVQDILIKEYGSLLNKEIRSHIDKDCFHCIYNIIKSDVSTDDGEAYETEIEYTPIGLKQNCIYFLAAYCRQSSLYTEDILKCILDHDLYNFSSNWETVTAIKCIEILNNVSVEQSPLELSFSLIQDMCKELFRNPKTTRGLLLIIKEMLNNIWKKNDPIMHQNCFIMIHSYLQRCEKLFYPPDVVALVYECVAKIVKLNNQSSPDIHNSLKDVLPKKIKGNDHKITLYCCHLLTYIVDDYSNERFQELTENLIEIFLINVSVNKDTVLQDELMNRTAAVLHCFYVLGISKSVSINQIVLKIIEFQTEKNMDKVLVKKVLNILTKRVTNNSIELYMNSNIIHILQYWFQNNKSFECLPLFLFGFDNIDDLLKHHLRWLVSTDILWRSNGLMESSELLKYVRNKTGQSLENTVEMCFCNIIALSLPYIVIEKYKIETGKPHDMVAAGDANKMFQATRQVLKDEKWSNLFVENLGELVLLTARHISDHTDASQLFGVQLIKETNSYTYSKNVFSGILKYFGELIDGNIMQYLCENQPLLLFNILFKLWDKVLREKVYTYKVLDFHAYLAFVDNIPFGYSSDAILSTFVCANIANAIKKSQTKEDIKIFIDGLKIVSTKILTKCHNYKDKFKISMLPKIISILNFKIAEGFTDCDSLLSYLTDDMKDNFVEDEDVVDFIDVLSQCQTKNYAVASKFQFRDKLKTYASSLSHASHETLAKLRKFVKHNSIFVNDLYVEASEKGFSEDCKISIVHQIIFLLSNLMKTTSDDKVIIEACNCLAEIGSYDIKTLVTVPPINTTRIVELSPTQYFAESALQGLSEHLFDEDPAVSNTIAKAISKLLKFNDGQTALDAVERDKDILLSLLSVNDQTYAKYKIDNKKFDLYNSIDYWIHIKDESHSQWIMRITLAFLDLLSSSTNYLGSLSAVCAIKPSVCKKILPALMGLILYCSTDIHAAVIGEQINQFFKFFWDLSFEDDLENSEVAGTPKMTKKINYNLKMIVNYLLDIVDFIRIQKGHYRSRTRGRQPETLNYLNLDYGKVSWAAAVAEQHLSAIFYEEVCAAADGRGEHGDRILRRCYVSIGEMDAIDGCGTAHLTIEHEKRKHLLNTGQYADALLLCDIALSRGHDHAVLRGAVTSLHNSGMHHLALQYIKSCPPSDNLDDIKYDCLSYLGDWSDFVDTVELEDKSRIGNLERDSIIKAMRYSCLKDCLNIKPTIDFELKLEKPLIRAKLATARLCQSLNMENSQSVYKLVGYLHLFRDIERYFSVRCDKMSLTKLIGEWKVDNLPVFNDFKHLEALISQRSLILEHAAETHSEHFSEVTDLQLEYAELGLSNQRIQMAQRLIASVKNNQPSKKVALIESQITWAKGHKDIALSLLKGLITQESQDINLTAMSLRQYGLWMSESKRENARDIIHKYLEKSLEALNSCDDNEIRFKVYYDIATFADAEYKQVVSYMNSSVFENKVKCVENMKGTAASLKSSQHKLTKDERKAFITNNAFRLLDEAEITNTKGEKESFLKMAMKYYLLSLRHCDENNLSVFRVISLWFDNPGFDFEDDNLLRDLEAVPSWKFITVLPQLAPRLTDENTPFTNHLKKILKRCALEHPHHTLPILLNLKNSDKDSTILNASGSVSQARAGEARVLSAAGLLQELANTKLSTLISQMELICDATISFAYYKPKTKETKNFIPKAEPISRLKNLNAIPIPTDTIEIRKDCDYSRVNTLISFNNYFELVGGINCPKKISCTRSDGKMRTMLIKGEDDLRQDAVMQQVFNIVNTLLEKNPITYRNKLSIRTYKVVGMSRRAGALEWCAGTQPLGAYLTHAHPRYRPADITPAAARTKLKDCHENGRSAKQKLEAFNEILKVFRPVFHYFFTEHYLDAVTWYERRLAYTRSVATSSMVGYIMGLGDRHVQNILIDETTAEVIHIDFGIAFDQGKTLPTPETVPFRLTQDIIAGFGSSGVEGIFRRCCERTLQLLRDHQEILLTILEVLLCDPLYLWIISTNSKAKTSNSRSPSSSALASRALLGVRSKLCGWAGAGAGAGGVSVAGHVAQLLAEARDPANLCRLFPGWQPYL